MNMQDNFAGIFNRLLKHVVIYGTGDFILKIASFATLPIYTRIFSPSEYGVWNIVGTIIGLVTIILSLGGETTYQRFFFDAKKMTEREVVTSTWFGFLCVWSFGVASLCVLLSRFFSQWAFGTDRYTKLFWLGLLAVPISLMNSMCGQVLRNQFRAKLFSTLNVITTILSVGLCLYGVVVLKLGLLGVFGGALVAVCIMLPVRLWTVRSMLKIVFSFGLLKRLLMFSIPLIPMSLAYWIFGLSDRVVLGKLSTLDEAGLYGIAVSLTTILTLINSSIGQGWAPTALKIYEEDQNRAPVYFGRMMTYIVVGFGFMGVLLTTFAKELLLVLTTPAYSYAAKAVGPLTLAMAASASTQVTALSISLTMKTKYFALYSWLAAILNLVLNIIFVPIWGMMAASWTTALSYIFLTVAYAFKSQRLWPVQYEKGRMFKGVTLIIVFTVVAGFFPEMSLIFSIIFKSLYCFTFIGLLIVSGVLDKREWGVISSLVGHKLAFANFSK